MPLESKIIKTSLSTVLELELILPGPEGSSRGSDEKKGWDNRLVISSEFHFKVVLSRKRESSTTNKSFVDRSPRTAADLRNSFFRVHRRRSTSPAFGVSSQGRVHWCLEIRNLPLHKKQDLQMMSQCRGSQSYHCRREKHCFIIWMSYHETYRLVAKWRKIDLSHLS